MIISLSMTAMLALAAYQVTYEQMTLGDFVLINAFMMQLFIPLNFLGFVYREIKGSLANIEHMFGLLKKIPKVQDKADAGQLQVNGGNIDIEEICFSYDAKRPILEKVSFSVGAGKKVAIVGESGSGKSTLVKLLLRFYDPDVGQILIDGQNIRSVTQDSLRSHIGMVQQDSALLHRSVRDNLLYGRPDASEAEIIAAAKQAEAHDFILDLEDPQGRRGYDAHVGERGVKLSGGQRQRITLARVILKDAPILLLDEIAAHLDADRRAALYDEICALGAQAWMTGTGREMFDDLGDRAQRFEVTETGGESRVRAT